jgi:hypothetical protein
MEPETADLAQLLAELDEHVKLMADVSAAWAHDKGLLQTAAAGRRSRYSVLPRRHTRAFFQQRHQVAVVGEDLVGRK